VNAYANSMTVTLTNSSTGPATPGLSFDGTSVFTTGHSLTAAVNGDVIVNSGATLGATGGAFTLSASGAGSSLTVDGAIVGKSVALASAGDASVAQGASVSATSGILSIKSTGTNSSLTADGDVSTTGGPITLQSTGAVTVGVGVTVDSGAGLLTLAADVTAAGNGDDGVGTLAIDAGATIVSSDASPSAITLRGADVNIDTSGNAAVLGASRELVAPANNTLTGVDEVGLVDGAGLMAFDTSGNLYVINSSSSFGTISKFAPGSTTPTATLTGLSQPSAMAFDGSGNLYVLDVDFPPTVVKFAPGGLKPVATLTTNALITDPPDALAVDASGNVYIGGGGMVSKFAPNSLTATAILTGLDDVSALAVDSSGNLYVANDGNDTVSKFAPNSTTPTATLAGVTDPSALAFDAGGNLYVANFGDDEGDGTTVSKFAPGSLTPTATLNGVNGPNGLWL
jgi:sugar lactone lactonase YvrE